MLALATQPTQHGTGAFAFEHERQYEALYALVVRVDDWLRAGYHLRDSQGQVITHLDEWCRAVERESR